MSLFSGLLRFTTSGRIAGPRTETKLTSLLSVSLGDSLNLVLLLDGERVGALLGAVHYLIGEALGS